MTIANCPNCRERVSVPDGVSRQARVRCPLCSEEYLLDDALRSLPPMLVLVHDPAGQGTEEPPVSPLLPAAFSGVRVSDAPADVMDEGSEELSFELSSPVVAPAFKFESPAVPAARAATVTTHPRTRRNQAGPVRLMVQTIGGGVMGLAIAQLILWWMPGNWHESKRDPFGLAAKVVPYAPFLVPTTLRGNVPTALADNPADAASRDKESDLAGPSAQGKNNRPKSANDLESSVPDFTLNTNEPTESANDVKKMDKTGRADDPDAVPAAVVAAKPMLKEPLGLRNPPTINVEEITTRLADVASAELAWDTAENPTIEQKTSLITEIYKRLAKLGDAIAVIGTAQPEAAIPSQPIVVKLTTLAAQPEKLTPIGKLGGLWVKDHRDEGAVLVGMVLSHQPCGKLFETQVRLYAKSNPVVSVISTTDLAEQLALDSNVLILGRLVTAPEKNLAGYEGNAHQVLLHGVHVAVPEPNPNP